MAARLSKNGKRLGRPPKNKTLLTVQQEVKENKAKVFVIDSNEEREPANELTEIECELMPVKPIMESEGTGERYGRYSASAYSMNKFGLKGWVAIAYVKADFETYRKQKLSKAEILQRCTNYLNRIERKKFQKKEPAPKYGYLRLYDPETVKFLNKYGTEVACVEFVTDDRKNENFWGEGDRY